MMKKTEFKKLLFIPLLILALCLMFSCGGKANNIVGLIDAGEFEDAIDAFDEAWDDDKLSDDDLDQLEELLEAKLEGLSDAYASGEKSYEDVTQITSTARYILGEADLSTKKVDQVIGEIAMLKISKDRYQEGQEALSEGRYETAYNCFDGVSADDTANYDNAQAKKIEVKKAYNDDKIAQAKTYVDQGDYYEAINILDNAYWSSLADEDALSAEIANIRKLQEDQQVQQEKDNVLSNAQNMVDQGDYEGALGYLQDFIDDHKDAQLSDVTDAMNKYKSDYVNLIVTRVNNLRGEKKYLAALTILENAKLVVSDAQFDQLETTIKGEKPLYLAELKYQDSSRYDEITSGTLEDTIGTAYDVAGGNLFRLDNTGFVNYYVGYKYDSIVGTVAVDDRSESITARFVVEGDGVELLSIPLSRMTTPTAVNLNIANVNYLTFKIVDSSGYSWSHIYAILSNFTLTTPSAAPSTPATPAPSSSAS